MSLLSRGGRSNYAEDMEPCGPDMQRRRSIAGSEGIGMKFLVAGGALLVAVTLSLAACSGPGGTASVATLTPTPSPTPSASAAPTPTATPTPAPGSVTLSINSISFAGTGAANSQTVTASQSNYGGQFAATTPAGGQPNSCSGIATISPTTSSSSFTIAPVGLGHCTFTITGGNGQTTTLTVDVTTTTVGGQSKRRAP